MFCTMLPRSTIDAVLVLSVPPRPEPGYRIEELNLQRQVAGGQGQRPTQGPQSAPIREDDKAALQVAVQEIIDRIGRDAKDLLKLERHPR